jgi:hypothetical protein
MTCQPHLASEPCPFCEWAASGNATKIRAADGRAARVAGGNYPAIPTSSARNDSETPKSSPFASLADVKSCPARYRESCGCAEPYRCILRFHGRVTTQDCMACKSSDGEND